METTNTSKQEKLKKFLELGPTMDLVSPSGHTFTIREQNGHDDDILSNREDAKTMDNMNKFISAIVVKTNFTKTGKITAADAKNLLLKDKYFLVFSSRIFSIGAILKFTYEWPASKKGGQPIVAEYEEDLSQYLLDYSKPCPKEGEPGYFKYAIQPYPEEPYSRREVVLTSQKTIRFKLMDGHSEAYQTQLVDAKMTHNSDLLAREVELLVEGEYIKVEDFRIFTKRDMVEIHKVVDELDTPFMGLTELENPDTGEIIRYPLIALEDFFYPERI